MDEIITTRNADEAPIESAQIPQENPSIDTQAGSWDNPQSQPEPSPITQEATPVEGSIPAKEDMTRFEYWQSQNDKASTENQKLKQELDYYKNTLDPIARHIDENPQILDTIEASVSNGQQGVPSGNGTNPASLQMPVKPQKPVAFNEVDAFNDPESDSYKYRQQLDTYRDTMQDYLFQREEVREQQYKANMARQQETMLLNQVQSHMTNSYKWEPNKVNEFMRWAQNPANITVDRLAKLYEMENTPSQSDAQLAQRKQAMQNEANRMNIPRTSVVEKGQAPPPMNDEDMFNAGLMSLKRT